jgi:Ca2+-binding RTX toxin-like protein
MEGGSGNDTLNSGGGDDYMIGDGSADVFQFSNGSGADVIDDFSVGEDLIAIGEGFGVRFGNNRALDRMITDDSDGAIIAFDRDDQVQLLGVAKSDLSWSDFQDGF